MAQLQWDKAGEKLYEVGVDRGVLYLRDGSVAVWNGLRSVDESYERENQSYYLDGVKYLQVHILGDFSARLAAYTYPDEFEKVNGSDEVASGMFYHAQPPKPFNLSYRTRIGNDIDGMDHGYKIHVLYNVVATPEAAAYRTLEAEIQAVEFAWTLAGTQPVIEGHRPTVHVTIDSTKTNPDVLEQIEKTLYGSDLTNPHLPSINELTDLFAMYGALIIVDNGDGTWQAIDLADQYISMDSSTQFTINNVDATYSDSDTYSVSTTTPD